MKPERPKPPLGKKPVYIADYQDATPKQVAEAVARHWAGPGPKPKNRRWLWQPGNSEVHLRQGHHPEPSERLDG